MNIKGILKNHGKILLGIIWLFVIVPVSIAAVFCLVEVSAIDNKPELLRGIGLFLLGVGMRPLACIWHTTEPNHYNSRLKLKRKKLLPMHLQNRLNYSAMRREAARQGGIYALGRLADENPRLHPMIMDIVASYVRQESRRWYKERENEKYGSEAVNRLIDKSELIDLLSSEPMPMDVEAAIAVIRERKVEHDKKTWRREIPLRFIQCLYLQCRFQQYQTVKV